MPKGKSNLSQQLAEKYYTPQEAMQRLGMTRDMFNNHVKRGTIIKHDLIGKHGLFLKKDIDGLAIRIEAALMAAGTSMLKFRVAKKEDLPAINSMAYLNFGELSRSPERIDARRRFIEANPESTFVLVDGNTIVASIDLVPLRHEAILQFREGVRGWTFPRSAIEQFEPGHRLEAIIIDMMTSTILPMNPPEDYPTFRERKRSYAFALLSGLRDKLIEWGHKGIDIKSVDACGGYEDGKHILKTAGFTSIGTKQNGREIFTLDIDQSQIKMLEPYKQALAEWRRNS